MTCVDDGRDHAVPDVELVRGGTQAGCCRAVCGHLVTAAAMTTPQGEPCPGCSSICAATEARPAAASWSTLARRIRSALTPSGVQA